MTKKIQNISNNVFSNYRDPTLGKKIEQLRKEDAKNFWKKNYNKFTERSCPICNNKKSIALEPYIDLYPILKCSHCTLVYVSLAPSQKNLDDYYQNAESIKLLNSFYKSRKKENKVSQSRINLIKENLPKKETIKILEIGCGNGSFLDEIKKSNPDKKIITYGIEPNREAAQEARERGANILESYVGMKDEKEYFENIFFDMIICFELIEHLINPRYLFINSYNKLLPQGLLILSTPNIDGLSNYYLNYNSERLTTHAIAPPMHLQGFSRLSLAILANLTQFSIKSIDAKGIFDIYELQLYINENKITEKKAIFSLLREKNLSIDLLELIQRLSQDLNSSAAMTAVLQKNLL